MSENPLFDTLKHLFHVITGTVPSPDLLTDLEDLIEGNGLDDTDHIPAWIPSVFQAVVDKKTIPVAKQTPAAKEGASFYNFFDELSQIMPMTWVEYGEYFLMQFEPVALEIKVSLEDGTYEVRPISKTS